jgi:hypothetical protein
MPNILPGIPRVCGAQWSRPDEVGSDHPSIEARRGIETMKAIAAFSVLVRKETKKETTSSRTWKIETRKQTSQVALSKRTRPDYLAPLRTEVASDLSTSRTERQHSGSV